MTTTLTFIREGTVSQFCTKVSTWGFTGVTVETGEKVPFKNCCISSKQSGDRVLGFQVQRSFTFSPSEESNMHITLSDFQVIRINEKFA